MIRNHLLDWRRELASTLRQWAFPAELRIGAPALPLELLAAVAHHAPEPAPPQEPRSGEPQAGGEATAPPLDRGLLAALGTGLWRLRKQMVEPETGRPREEVRRTFRHLEALWDSCAQAGLEILDHTGQTVPEHGEIGLKILNHQPVADLAAAAVIDTIKPSVYFRRQWIQMGEVVVGVPGAPAAVPAAAERQAAG